LPAPAAASSFTFGGGGHWRLFHRILALREPWRSLTEQEFRREFKGVDVYIKDLLRRHEGEVVETVGTWQFYPHAAMPVDDGAAWHRQFAKTLPDRLLLRQPWHDIDKAELLKKHTTVLSSLLTRNCQVYGHSRRVGNAITLGELMLAVGDRYTLMEIYHWYYHANRLCHKRDHSWGSEETQAAAKLRYKEFGTYGHRAAERAGWYRDSARDVGRWRS